MRRARRDLGSRSRRTSRGTGVGRRLVEAAEEWAQMCGLTVMAGRSNNVRTEAKEFYEHLG